MPFHADQEQVLCFNLKNVILNQKYDFPLFVKCLYVFYTKPGYIRTLPAYNEHAWIRISSQKMLGHQTSGARAPELWCPNIFGLHRRAPDFWCPGHQSSGARFMDKPGRFWVLLTTNAYSDPFHDPGPKSKFYVNRIKKLLFYGQSCKISVRAWLIRKIAIFYFCLQKNLGDTS